MQPPVNLFMPLQRMMRLLYPVVLVGEILKLAGDACAVRFLNLDRVSLNKTLISIIAKHRIQITSNAIEVFQPTIEHHIQRRVAVKCSIGPFQPRVCMLGQWQ